MLWLLAIGCGQEEPEQVVEQPQVVEEDPVVLGKEVQALWKPIEKGESKLNRRRFLVWDKNNNGTLDNNTELISVFDNDGNSAFTDGYAMLSHYFDANRDGVLRGEELSKISLWRDVKTPTLFNRTANDIGITLQPLSETDIKEIDLQSPAANFPIVQEPLCVLDSIDSASTTLWVPPLAGPIANECDPKILFCHEPLGITEYINNSGIPIDANASADLPFYPMAQPLESCFPGPSQYLDIRFEDGVAAVTTKPETTDLVDDIPESAEISVAVETNENRTDTQENIETPDNGNTVADSSQDVKKEEFVDEEEIGPSEVILMPKLVFAQTHRFSSETSILVAQTFNDTDALVSSFGDDHAILARTWSGSIRWHPKDPKQCLIDFRISVKGLDPDPDAIRAKYNLEGKLGSGEREDIKQAILTPDQLDADNHPNILFQAYSCTATEGMVKIMGMLTIRGIEREVRFVMKVNLDNGFYAEGTFSVEHSDFDFEPYSAPLGVFRNRQQIRFFFELNSLPLIE